MDLYISRDLYEREMSSLNLYPIQVHLLFPCTPPPQTQAPAPSSSLTWSLHSSATTFPVYGVMGGQQFDKPIKGPHVSPWRPRMASVTRSHSPPVCQPLWLTGPVNPTVLTLTPTPSTPLPPPKNPHTLKIIWSGLPLINMTDKSCSLTLLLLVSPPVEEEGRRECRHSAQWLHLVQSWTGSLSVFSFGPPDSLKRKNAPC